MEKAKLSINKTNKGKLTVEAHFLDSGKKMPVLNLTHPDIASLHEKEVEINRVGGHIEKITYNGETIFSKSQTTPKKVGQMKNPTNTATAPYNFVPLNVVVVPSMEEPGKGDCTLNKYHKGKHTGHITLKIETKTPLYIRDALDINELQEKERLKLEGKKYINPAFFSPARRTRIPGSSLRGMTRTMVEIVSYSKFGSFEKERKYHFRSFADKSFDLKEKYKERILCGDKQTGFSQQVKAGYLIKDGRGFKIKPAQVINGCQFFRVEEDLVIQKGVLTEKMNKVIHKDNKEKYDDNENYRFGFKSVRFTFEQPQIHNNHSEPMYYAKVTNISNTNKSLKDSIEGALVHSGWMRGPRYRPRGKHLHWVIGPPSNEKLEFLSGVIEDYKNDKDRHKEANLLHCFEDDPEARVPCFYVEENGQVESFGHTGLFRLAYKHKLNDLLPTSMREFTVIDIAEAIFGNEKTFAGRVFFEDVDLCKNQTDILMAEDIPKILSNPKPTTFQHYLEQNTDEIRKEFKENGELRWSKGIKNFNDDARLRGNKLYWHKSGYKWQEDKIAFFYDDFKKLLQENHIQELDFKGFLCYNGLKAEVALTSLPEALKSAVLKAIGIYETQHTKITPVNQGKYFTGKIRFENLSDIELGALLFALDLPDKCCHKLGMGKPLGLGSVKITPTLFLSDRKTRYTDLFAEWETPIPESTSENQDITHFKKEFAKYVLGHIGKETATNPVNELWQVDRMNELKTMLNFEKKPDDDKTQYMPLGKFEARNVLPKPTELFNEAHT